MDRIVFQGDLPRLWLLLSTMSWVLQQVRVWSRQVIAQSWSRGFSDSVKDHNNEDIIKNNWTDYLKLHRKSKRIRLSLCIDVTHRSVCVFVGTAGSLNVRSQKLMIYIVRKDVCDLLCLANEGLYWQMPWVCWLERQDRQGHGCDQARWLNN